MIFFIEQDTTGLPYVETYCSCMSRILIPCSMRMLLRSFIFIYSVFSRLSAVGKKFLYPRSFVLLFTYCKSVVTSWKNCKMFPICWNRIFPYGLAIGSQSKDLRLLWEKSLTAIRLKVLFPFSRTFMQMRRWLSTPEKRSIRLERSKYGVKREKWCKSSKRAVGMTKNG